jgi:hypothetical protein
MGRISDRVNRIAPNRFELKVLKTSSSLRRRKRQSALIPAEFTTTFGSRFAFSRACITLSPQSGNEMSHSIAMWPGPIPHSSAWTDSTSTTFRQRAFASDYQSASKPTTVASSLASLIATARPIPFDAPETTATLPFNIINKQIILRDFKVHGQATESHRPAPSSGNDRRAVRLACPTCSSTCLHASWSHFRDDTTGSTSCRKRSASESALTGQKIHHVLHSFCPPLR